MCSSCVSFIFVLEVGTQTHAATNLACTVEPLSHSARSAAGPGFMSSRLHEFNLTRTALWGPFGVKAEGMMASQASSLKLLTLS